MSKDRERFKRNVQRDTLTDAFTSAARALGAIVKKKTLSGGKLQKKKGGNEAILHFLVQFSDGNLCRLDITSDGIIHAPKGTPPKKARLVQDKMDKVLRKRPSRNIKDRTQSVRSKSL